MNKDLKKLWVEALRSGKYKQTKGRLQSADGNAYCCLGVLEHCVMGVEYGPQYRRDANPDMLLYFVKNPKKATCKKADLLSTGVQFWFMNDHKGMTFTEIADYIEANL